MAGYRFFPKRTVHLAVIDPGVGSTREAIALRTADYFFVGPDNGVLSWALRAEKIKAIHSLKNESYFLSPVSRTFHGRDIFASVAAHLSCGVPIGEFGPAQKDFVRLPWPATRLLRGGAEGEILYFDRFGNAITNLDTVSIGSLDQNRIEVSVKGKRLCSVCGSYDAVAPGKPLAVIGSSGFLEIAVNGDNAAKRLRLRVGEAVKLEGR
jgi:S-adenosylmethionine hydrolase